MPGTDHAPALGDNERLVGEIELRGDGIGGIAVNIAARVAENAGPGETLVSSTVKDRVAGSALRFDADSTR